MLTLISASLSIQNSSSITIQNSLFNLFLSTVNIIDSTISEIETIETAVRVTSSTLNITNTNISMISNPARFDFMLITLDSTLIMNSLIFENSTSNLFNARNTMILINGIRISNVSSFSDFIKISSSSHINITQYETISATTGTNEQILVSDSSDVSLSDLEVHDTPELIIDVINSNITSISDLKIHNCLQAIQIHNSVIDQFENCNLTNNGNVSQRVGGAVYLFDSNVVTMHSNLFINNTANQGGAIYFQCSQVDQCQLNITDVQFVRNMAVRQGGAIYYDYVRPTLFNVIYQENMAQYGPNIASYPVKIKLINLTEDDVYLRNVGSGIAYEQTLNFGLYDFDDQIMVLDNSNQITISPVDSQASSISGTNVGLLSQGVASFDNLIFVSTPGSTNVLYRATSKVIDTTKIQNVFGQTISDNNIYIDFRF